MKWYLVGLAVLAALAIGVLAPAQKMLTLYMPGESLLDLFGWSLSIAQLVMVLCGGAAVMALIVTPALLGGAPGTPPSPQRAQRLLALGGAVLPALGICAGGYSLMISRIAALETNTTNLAVIAPGQAAALFCVAVCATAGFISLACATTLLALRPASAP